MTWSRLGWRTVGTAVAVLSAAALRWSTVAPWPTRAAERDAAQMRLSLSARPERIERCRQLSDEELAKLPAHMRLRTECEGFSASYQLTLTVDEDRLVVDTLRGGGLRKDRPIHLYREYELQPGSRRLRIEVNRIDDNTNATADSAATGSGQPADTLMGGRAERERDERARRAAEAMPARLKLDTLLTVAARRVVLVTFDNSTRRLVARMER